jgi:hypothetical protein
MRFVSSGWLSKYVGEYCHLLNAKRAATARLLFGADRTTRSFTRSQQNDLNDVRFVASQMECANERRPAILLHFEQVIAFGESAQAPHRAGGSKAFSSFGIPDGNVSSIDRSREGVLDYS